MSKASGSGLNDTNVSNCLLSLDPNKSTDGVKPISVKHDCRILEFNFHSAEVLAERRDSLSASIFCFPGICASVNHMLRSMHESQICLHKLLQVIERLVPMCDNTSTAVELSDKIFICLSVRSFAYVSRQTTIVLRWKYFGK